MNDRTFGAMLLTCFATLVAAVISAIIELAPTLNRTDAGAVVSRSEIARQADKAKDKNKDCTVALSPATAH